MKQNSVKKDIGLAVGSVAAFYAILALAKWVDSLLGLAEIFTLVDIASMALKAATISAGIWIMLRFVFPRTLGHDFGDAFDRGWDSMQSIEKTRWIIATFLALFVALSLL